jgi:hypothetical protein
MGTLLIFPHKRLAQPGIMPLPPALRAAYRGARV